MDNEDIEIGMKVLIGQRETATNMLAEVQIKLIKAERTIDKLNAQITELNESINELKGE